MTKSSSLLLALLLFGILKVASACSCVGGPTTPLESIKFSDVTFSGKVISISLREYSKIVTFQVEKTWKGDDSSVITLTTGKESGICGHSYGIGESWLVYANYRAIGSAIPMITTKELQTDSCRNPRTMRLEYAHDDLNELGAGKTPVPISSGHSKAVWIVPSLFLCMAGAWV